LKRYEDVEATYRRKGLRHCLTLVLLAKGAALMQVERHRAAENVFAEAAKLAAACSLQYEAELAVLLADQNDSTMLLLNFP
jgi:hypothetical protein